MIFPYSASSEAWRDSETGLLNYLQERHGWTAASEYAAYYAADVRQALQPLDPRPAVTRPSRLRLGGTEEAAWRTTGRPSPPA